MTELMPIADFCKINEKYNSPQKVNYAIRKQDAPVDTSSGKRMIDPTAWAAWEGTPSTGTTSTSSSATSATPRNIKPKSREAVMVMEKRGIKQGSMLAWKSGQENNKIAAGKVVQTADEYCNTMIDDLDMHSPLPWDTIDRYIEEKKMVVVNYPEQLMFVLAAHYQQAGEQATADALLGLYKQHKTEDAQI